MNEMNEINLYWHVHHDELCEWSRNIEERIEYIQRNKPADEIPIRLRWLTPVLGPLPPAVQTQWAALRTAQAAYDTVQAALDTAQAALDTACANYKTARANYDTAWANYKTTRANYDTAWATIHPLLKALHAQEHPGCPWDGRTLFPVK